MKPSEFWRKQDGKTHITAGKTAWPEGFDVLGKLTSLLGNEKQVVEIGCGYGRLAPAFDPERYFGFDINRNAIYAARLSNPDHEFIWLKDDSLNALPPCTAVLAYTVLLHVPDENISAFVAELCKKTDRFILAEIMGQHWRRPGGTVPVFNRDKGEYEKIFADAGFSMVSAEAIPYRHYRETDISFLDFRRSVGQ